jgi:hypothetical protein
LCFLNKGTKKHKSRAVKEAIKEINDFESLSVISSSKVLSEPFIEINTI